jgi:two-component system OmpR family sensor kinase
LSLRTRLLAGMLGLVTVALVVAAVSIYAEQRSFLLSRLDQRVIAAASPISYQLGIDARLLSRPIADENSPDRGHGAVSPLGKGLAGFLPSGTYGELVDPDGKLLRGPVTVSNGEAALSPPRFPTKLPSARSGTSPQLFTVNSEHGSSLRYRVATLPLESGAGTVVVAVPLREVDQTLHELIVVEALVVGGVIVLLVGLGWIVIRFGLRPLRHMERVASEIADGDLTRRVTPATARTELGRLGLSLNKMLVRIEEAFADRERSDERRRQFLADASHELRTPLASIRGYAELFRLGPAQDPVALKRAMARIESEAARMGVLVEGLLLLARVDALPETERVPVELTELCAQAAADARARAPERTVTLDVQDPVKALADPDAVRQVLANLIGNALIHTPEWTPVEIAVRHERGEAIIEVRDHGPGLPADVGDKVFDRFWRTEAGRTRGPGGAGLGLAIVRELAIANYGTVEAASHPEGGALFTVRLPEASPDIEPEASGAALDPAPAAVAP